MNFRRLNHLIVQILCECVCVGGEHVQVCTIRTLFPSLEPRLSVPRFCLIFLQSCEAKSGTECVSSRLPLPHCLCAVILRGRGETCVPKIRNPVWEQDQVQQKEVGLQRVYQMCVWQSTSKQSEGLRDDETQRSIRHLGYYHQ